MAKKVNQFAQVVQDIRKEIRAGQKSAAKVNTETFQASLNRLDPKSDPIRQAIKDSGISLATLREKLE